MSTNGKGSAQRRQTKEERKQFEDNYDAIFKKTPPAEPAERVARMTKQAFDSLNEYSTTLPTTPSVGRRWKRAIPWHKPDEATWWLAEVFALPESDPKHKTENEIRWARIEIEG